MLTRISGRPAAYEASYGHSINDYSDRLLLAALLVLTGLEVVLVARANDGGVTARLVEEPLAEGLLGTGLMGRMGWDVKGQGATFVGFIGVRVAGEAVRYRSCGDRAAPIARLRRKILSGRDNRETPSSRVRRVTTTVLSRTDDSCGAARARLRGSRARSRDAAIVQTHDIT